MIRENHRVEVGIFTRERLEPVNPQYIFLSPQTKVCKHMSNPSFKSQFGGKAPTIVC